MLNFKALHDAGNESELPIEKWMIMNESVAEFLRIILLTFLCPIKKSSSSHLLLCKSWVGSGGRR